LCCDLLGARAMQRRNRSKRRGYSYRERIVSNHLESP